MSEKYAFIRDEKAEFSVRLLCRVLNVSHSGFYEWCHRQAEPSARAIRHAELTAAVTSGFDANHGRYGAPRLHAYLRHQGVDISLNTVARIMRAQGLVARQRRAFRVTTDSKHNQPVNDNVLKREFTTEAPNQAWVGDITYIRTREGWLYLAVLIDLYSRKVVGWALSVHIDTALVLTALNMATGVRQPGRGLIHHTDRGSQYCSNLYQGALSSHGIVSSMSRKGDCWDNAVAESFFGSLKNELVHPMPHAFITRDQARRHIANYIYWFNTQRLHSTLNGRRSAM